MKTVFGIAVALLIFRAATDVNAHYQYERRVASFWNLSVKASTITAKADYLDQFVAAVDSARLSGNNALLFPTPDNSVEQNVATLKTLQHRMAEIRGMDVQSFAYQQAISQVTAQEQDEAQAMLGVIKGAWYLTHHPLLWDWINVVLYLVIGGCAVIPGFVILSDL